MRSPPDPAGSGLANGTISLDSSATFDSNSLTQARTALYSTTILVPTSLSDHLYAQASLVARKGPFQPLMPGKPFKRSVDRTALTPNNTAPHFCISCTSNTFVFNLNFAKQRSRFHLCDMMPGCRSAPVDATGNLGGQQQTGTKSQAAFHTEDQRVVQNLSKMPPTTPATCTARNLTHANMNSQTQKLTWKHRQAHLKQAIQAKPKSQGFFTTTYSLANTATSQHNARTIYTLSHTSSQPNTQLHSTSKALHGKT